MMQCIEKEMIDIKPYFMAKQDDYTVIYNLTYDRNRYYEEKNLWEYGVVCSLYNSMDELISETTVSCISPNKDTVLEIIYKLVKNVVFPVHLQDVIYNIINS